MNLFIILKIARVHGSVLVKMASLSTQALMKKLITTKAQVKREEIYNITIKDRVLAA